MADLVNWLWQGCLVALATAAVLRMLQRSRARDRYVLCWIALLIVLALPVMSAGWFAAPPAPAAMEAADGLMVSMPTAWWTSSTLFIVLWAFWCTVHGVRVARAVVALRRARQDCQPFPADVETRLCYWMAVSPRGRPTRLLLSNSVRSAAVLGCGPPMIGVAPALLQHLDVDELDRVVVHEWAHVQRCDDVVNFAHFAVRAAAGWHPAVLWLDRQLQLERESACDEIAVSITRCPKAYAASLAAIASLLPMRMTRLPAPSALSASGFASRVRRILAQKKLASQRWSTSAAMCAVLTIGAASMAIAGLRIAGTRNFSFEHHEISMAAALQPSAMTGGAESPDASGGTPRLVARHPSPANAASQPGPQARLVVRAATSDAIAASAAPVADDSRLQSIVLGPVPALDSRSPVGLLPADPTVLAVMSGESAGGVAANPAPTGAPSPWRAAVEAGVVIGRRSGSAAVTTAGLFSRFGKKIAASF